MNSVRNFLAIIAVVLSGVCLDSEPQDVPTRQVPHFRLDVDLVEVDVVVTGEDGLPVHGLTVNDIQLREDGVPQEISFFDTVGARAAAAAVRAEPGDFDDVHTNTVGRDGRLIVIVLDSDSPNTGRVRHYAREFITKHLSGDDLAALLVTGVDARDWVFTRDKSVLLAGVDSFSGGLPGRVIDTLEIVANRLEPIRGRRKVLVLFSQGFGCEVDESLECPDNPRLSTDVREAVGAITRAGVSIYPVDVRGLTGPRDEAIAEPPISGAAEPLPGVQPRARPPLPGVEVLGLRALAMRTGGVAFVNSNDFDGGFDRIRREAASYYLLGYYPSNARRSGALRRIDVRVRRPDLEVRARSVYEEPRADALTADPVQGTDSDEPLVALARTPLAVNRGLELTVQAAPFGRRADRGVVAVVVDLAGRNLDFTEIDGLLTSQVRWFIWITDHDGTLVARDGGRADLRLTHERAALVRELGARLVASFDLPSGRYRLRTAVQASGSRAGALFADLDVPEVDGATLELSGILLTSKSAGAATALRRLPDLPMPAMPTTRRTFSQDDMLAFAAHISVPATAPVIVTATLTGNGGRVERRFENRYDADSPGASNIYSRSLPLDGLPPGSYVLEVRARTTPSTLATVIRRVPLEITPARDVPTAREGSEAPSTADLVSLLESAGERIVEYEWELSGLVAEEQYLQESVSIGGPASRGSAGRRVLRSDILFVRAPGADDWTAFRDVFEVDRKPVRDRESRLTRLFLEPNETNVSQARRILDESARYNIGPVRRNINVPTTPLLVLHPDYQRRFRFSGPRSTDSGGVPAWEIGFHEIARPTIVTAGGGGDLPMRGRLWLDRAWMHVVRTELVLDDRASLRVRTEVAYGYVPGIGPRVPLRMEERYESRRHQNRIRGVAEYSNFRRFRVVTDEKIRLPGSD